MSEVKLRKGGSVRIDRLKDETEYVLDEVKSLSKWLDKNVCRKADLHSTLNALASKVDRLDRKVSALADKLDGEDVTNLDTDYRTTIDSTN